MSHLPSLSGVIGQHSSRDPHARGGTTACGTSWHAALVGEYLIEALARIPVEVEYASELRYRNPPLDNNTLLFAITQSGETADTLAALREMKRRGHPTLAICNVVGSTIAQEADGGVYLHEDFRVRLTDLTMRRAELRWLGYPRRYSPDGKWPPIYDYHDARTTELWRDMSGWYTRYGDVRTLLREIDDRFVITRHGDEVAFEFDVERAPPLEEGWSRDFLFYANGYGKDTTINSACSNTVEPLPFHGMSKYPYGEEERYPYAEEDGGYLERYNTRGILWTGE